MGQQNSEPILVMFGFFRHQEIGLDIIDRALLNCHMQSLKGIYWDTFSRSDENTRRIIIIKRRKRRCLRAREEEDEDHEEEEKDGEKEEKEDEVEEPEKMMKSQRR